MSLDQALQTFFAEARELLDSMEDSLLHLEREPANEEAINAIFRAVHTIKGSAGLFALDQLVAFAHAVENVLARLRKGELTADTSLVSLILQCRDHLAVGVEAAATGQTLDLLGSEAGMRLRLALSLHMDEARKAPGLPEIFPVEEAQIEEGPVRPDARATWHLSLRFAPTILRDGMDPASFLRYLATIGDIVSIATLWDNMPESASMDPEICYLGFEVDLLSQASREVIEQVFEFAREGSGIRILPPEAKIGEYLQLISTLPESAERLGEILVASGAVTRLELDTALASQCAQQEARPPLGQVLKEEHATPEVLIDAALDKQKKIKERRVAESTFIRVEASKLDALITRVGELVIAGASTALLARRHQDASLSEASSLLDRLIENIRDHALSLRMVEIGDTFNRFRRVVHDVSREIGKDIELVIRGADTELDKTVVEKISDPLLHLVRNAMDHGIESAEERLARGKPARGKLELNAFHDSGTIVIEIADDGAGLNSERILAKARERGLVTEDQTLSEAEIHHLIFEPGFSTAATVTNLSGRGVGMDVVRRNVDGLRGSIDLGSVAGQGTTFRIRLPLTLAIIDGFLVTTGDAAFVLPLDTVVECIELGATVGEPEGRHYLNLRGGVLPFLRLRETFGIPGETHGRESVVVVRCGDQQAGIVVDRLHGELQTVIKPLGRLFQHLEAISGSTILGSGEVALILDVPTLLRRASGRTNRAAAREPGLAVGQ
ncbi:MAG: chemotaxis protein CheA [Burkholderiales bacterium]|nr:MAG: chemotaxis protein CheA [Burkholderiales bacterium]